MTDEKDLMDNLIKYDDENSSNSSDGFSQSSFYKEFIKDDEGSVSEHSSLGPGDLENEIDNLSCYSTCDESSVNSDDLFLSSPTKKKQEEEEEEKKTTDVPLSEIKA